MQDVLFLSIIVGATFLFLGLVHLCNRIVDAGDDRGANR